MEVNNKVVNMMNTTTNSHMSQTKVAKTQVVESANKISEKDKNKKIQSSENKKDSNYQGNQASKETLDRVIEEANDKYRLFNKEFSYDIHEKTNRVIVKIRDSQTDEIIKEIPSEESLDLAAKIKEMVGLLVDEKR